MGSPDDGQVVSFAPVYRPPWDELPRDAPYVVVLVRLDEGPQLLATLERIEPADVAIGMRVTAAFEPVGQDIALVRFLQAEG